MAARPALIQARESIMAPSMRGIDHVHIYVGTWSQVEPWYESVLGFRRADAFAEWAMEGGPLTLTNSDGSVHLALFESATAAAASTIAFGASGEQFLDWMKHFKAQALEFRLADHALSWSMYFSDPCGNLHEVTTYDHAQVAAALQSD